MNNIIEQATIELLRPSGCFDDLITIAGTSDEIQQLPRAEVVMASSQAFPGFPGTTRERMCRILVRIAASADDGGGTLFVKNRGELLEQAIYAGALDDKETLVDGVDLYWQSGYDVETAIQNDGSAVAVIISFTACVVLPDPNQPEPEPSS